MRDVTGESSFATAASKLNDIPEQHNREAHYSRPVTVVPFAYERKSTVLYIQGFHLVVGERCNFTGEYYERGSMFV